jgi:response regulator RpfG family c-di-GMP phosphodiesterase
LFIKNNIYGKLFDLMDKEKNIKILYIDDEINNLFAFKSNLRHDYNVLTTSNLDEVWEILNKNQDIRVIFCDKRMPVKNGIDLLRDIKAYYPHIVRIIITAYTNKEDIINSINTSHIFKYIEKPFNFTEIIEIIENSNKYFLSKVNKNIEIEKKDCETHLDVKDLRENVANRLLVINNLIREGYQKTLKKLGDKHQDYITSIKDSNYYALKHELISEIKHLV